MIMTNEEWVSYFDTHYLEIPDEILDYADESFDPDDELYFVYAAKMYYTLLHHNDD